MRMGLGHAAKPGEISLLFLPLEHPEPFAAVLGVMLYPGFEKEDRGRASAFAAQYLAGPLRELHQQGGSIGYDHLLRIATTGQVPLNNLTERALHGRAVGEMFKVMIALSNTRPALASWNNAARIVSHEARKHGAPSARSVLWAAKAEFGSVAHLWGALSIRGDFAADAAEGLTLADDFETFLTESEVVCDWGQTFKASRVNARPPLQEEVWRVDPVWLAKHPIRNKAKPGHVPHLTLSDEHLSLLRSAGQRK